jgi:hypothetical protein
MNIRSFIPWVVHSLNAYFIFDVTHCIIYAIVVVTVLAFIALVYKDAILLVTRPPRLGTGFGRVWAVARTTVFEARAARAWVVPVIWLIACTIINLLSRVYDDTERINLYLRVLLGGQSLLCLILLGVMACYSFPRERDRRTIITTASKPLSRLEYFLGKVVGFWVVALLLLGSMMVLTWAFMMVTNQYVKNVAAAHVKQQQKEYDDGKFGSDPPSPAMIRAAAEGELHAYDYITASGGMQIAGGIDYSQEPPTLFMKGGSLQHASYVIGIPSPTSRSRTGLIAAPASSETTPFFLFQFGYHLLPGATITSAPKIDVMVRLMDSPSINEQRTIALGQAGSGVAYANFALTDPYNFFSYDFPDAVDPGPMIVDVTCSTPGIYLEVYNGPDPNRRNVMVMNTDRSRSPGSVDMMAPLGIPQLRGFEKGDEQQIEGPKKDFKNPSKTVAGEVASWRFRNVKRDDVPVDADGNFTISLQLDEDRADDKATTLADVRVYKIYSPGDAVEREIVVSEKRTAEFKVPATMLDQTGMDLIVDVSCRTNKHWVGVKENSVRLDRAPSFFFVNLFKSELVIFCECALIVLIGVTCSLRLGWPVAMLMTGVCYVLGNVFEFVNNLVKDHGYTLLSMAESQKLQGSLIYRLGVGIMSASIHMLYFLVNALPNFTKFDAVKYIVDSRSMPWWDPDPTGGSVIAALGALGLYSIPFIAIGYLLIRKQEMA